MTCRRVRLRGCRPRDRDGFTPRKEFLSAVRERYGLREPVGALMRRFREQIVALVEPDPQVPAVLDRLRVAGWRIAIATNGATTQQWAKIRSAGLDGHIDAVTVSDEGRAAKPNRRVFDAAAKRCGARLSDGGWMIGDCAVRDIAGGQAAGHGQAAGLKRSGCGAAGPGPPPRSHPMPSSTRSVSCRAHRRDGA